MSLFQLNHFTFQFVNPLWSLKLGRYKILMAKNTTVLHNCNTEIETKGYAIGSKAGNQRPDTTDRLAQTLRGRHASTFPNHISPANGNASLLERQEAHRGL